MARRIPASYRAVAAMVAAMRERQQAALPEGFRLSYVRDLRVGDLLVSPATLQPLMEIARLDEATASGYVVISGTKQERTSRHKLDDVVIRER